MSVTIPCTLDLATVKAATLCSGPVRTRQRLGYEDGSR